MQAQVRLSWVHRSSAQWTVLGICVAAGLAIRAALYQVQTNDYTFFVSRWYDFIAQNGGFSALKYDLSNYNPPYLYLLTLATYLPVSELIAIKSISVVFDIVLAVFTYRILGLKYRQPPVPAIGAMVAFLAPTVIINGSAWGQCDAIYAAFCLGSLYFMLTDRPAWACILFGLAFSFKLQAIFFLPVLLILLLRDKRSALCLLLVPVTCAVLLLPAIAAGRDVQSLLNVYVNQAETGGMTPVRMPGSLQSQAGPSGISFGSGGGPQAPAPGGAGSAQNPGPGAGFGQGSQGGPGAGFGPGSQGGRGFGSGASPLGARGGGGSYHFGTSSFTFNAPSFYQWLPANAPDYWKWIGTLLAGLLVLVLGIIAFLNRAKLTRDVLLQIALLSVVALPFLLPKMHERYFYLADVMSISYAFCFPRYAFVAVIMQVSSLLSYAPYLISNDQPPAYLVYVAFAVLVLILVVATKLLATLYPGRVTAALPHLSMRKSPTPTPAAPAPASRSGTNPKPRNDGGCL